MLQIKLLHSRLHHGMTTPGISLIIPVYNASRFLGEAIDSALKQTVKVRQIIVVDDGSTDDSQNIARSYGEAVTVIAQSNGGSGAARNRGMAEADQPLISFLDADDRLAPEKLERQAKSLSDHPGAMVCVCRVRDFWSPEIPDAAARAANPGPQFRMGQPGTWLVRRDVFERVGVFNPSHNFEFTEGSELYTRMESAGIAVLCIDDVLVERRLHGANKTSNSKAHLEGIMELMKRRLDIRRASA